MRDALLCDLADLNQYTLIGMHDARLAPSPLLAESHAVEGDHNAFKKLFKKLLKQVDYVWLIAPETDGILLALSELCYAESTKKNGAKLIGNGFHTVSVGTSKRLSAQTLQAEKIHTIPVYGGDELMQPETFEAILQANRHVTQWLAKPEDGAGCEGIRLFESLAALRDWLRKTDNHLLYFAQAYQTGLSASFSLLCAGGKAWLLSANLQHIVIEGDRLKLTGITVNGASDYWQRFEAIAQKLVNALPDALGYVGVDVIIDAEQDQIYVIDINPRLTTSYIGLREAINHNPAQLILDCVLNDDFRMPTMAKNKVELSL
jgi:tyramine---L-glutamate ligase